MSTAPRIADGAPLVLRPGTPVLARSPGELQVGLDEPVVRLADTPQLRAALTAFGRPGGAPAPEHGTDQRLDEALWRLRLAGLVLTAPGPPSPVGPTPADHAQFGAAATQRRADRSEVRVEVTASPAMRTIIEQLVVEAGVALGPDSGGPPIRSRRAERHLVHLVVADGPIDRERVDPLVRASAPHLVLAGAAGGLRLGPFVEPGRTACLRCVDAHDTLHDPRRPLLVAQAAAQAAGQPPPRDPLLDRWALAWAVRDICRWAEGDVPSTWSATVDLGPLDAPSFVRWGRHPDCGCAWDDVLALP